LSTVAAPLYAGSVPLPVPDAADDDDDEDYDDDDDGDTVRGGGLLAALAWSWGVGRRGGRLVLEVLAGLLADEDSTTHYGNDA
jgi:hypothetical protein